MNNYTKRFAILDYDSCVAMRYHGCRRSFFDGLSRLNPALSIIFGGAAFATVVSDLKALAVASSLIVAVASALDLAFSISDRARMHEGLCRRWSALRAKLAVVSGDDDSGLRALEVMREEIGADTPPQLLALSVVCENREKYARDAGGIVKVPRYQLICANWLDLPWWQPT